MLSSSLDTLTGSADTSSRDRIQSYLRKLSADEKSLFGRSVDNFVTCTVESREQSPHVVTRNVRQFMTGLKNYLTRSGEGSLWKIVDEERKKVGPVPIEADVSLVPELYRQDLLV